MIRAALLLLVLATPAQADVNLQYARAPFPADYGFHCGQDLAAFIAWKGLAPTDKLPVIEMAIIVEEDGWMVYYASTRRTPTALSGVANFTIHNLPWLYPDPAKRPAILRTTILWYDVSDVPHVAFADDIPFWLEP